MTESDHGSRSLPSAVLHRHLHHNFLPILRGEGSYLVLRDGRKIFDGSGGAAVVCIGHGDSRVVKAAMKQMEEVAYCATVFYTTNICEQLCRLLVDSTNGQMARAYIVSSGKSPRPQRLAGLTWCRIRGHGGGDEVGPAILSREKPP